MFSLMVCIWFVRKAVCFLSSWFCFSVCWFKTVSLSLASLKLLTILPFNTVPHLYSARDHDQI